MVQNEQGSQLPVKSEFDIPAMVKSVGDVKLTKKQEDILFADVPEEQIEIREDGIVYLPHIFYSGRLRKAFGWEFAFIPDGKPQYLDDRKLFIWGFHAIVKGSYLAYAVGQQKWQPGDFMEYPDAMEGAKSNALMRLCKDLGIGTDLWKPEFVKAWQDKWAYQGKNKKGKTAWFKRKTAKINGETEITEKSDEYMEIENSIRKMLDDPDFTGAVNLVNEKTGQVEDYNLDEQRTQILSRINSPSIYKMNILQNLEARCTKLLIAKSKQESQEVPETEVEGGGDLGDDELFDPTEVEVVEDDPQQSSSQK